MRTLKLTIPHLPYPELSPNVSLHWSKVAKVKKIARQEIGWLACSEWHGDKPMIQAVISYEFTVTDDRARDSDNFVASMKSSQDGLIDAGVIFYDDSKHLKLGDVTVSKGVKETTTVTVEEVELCGDLGKTGKNGRIHI